MHSKIRDLFLVGLLAAMPGMAGILQVSIDTTPLAGSSGSLAFDFLDGGPPSNTITISGFNSDGAVGNATLTGGASGTLPGPVQLTDSSFFNEYLTGFTFGNTLSFQIMADLLPPSAGSSPDEFAFYLLTPDASASLVTTSDPSGADALFTLDSAGNTAVFTSAQETTTLAPEPSSFLLLAGGLALLMFRRRRLRAAWLGLGLALLGLTSHAAFAQGFSFTKVVDQNTPRPDGVGNFSNIHFPSTDGRFVVWQEFSGASIWSKDLTTSTIVKLADQNTPAPGGTGTFAGGFGQTAGGSTAGFGLVVRSGLAAFLGYDTAFGNLGQGLYTVPATGGAIQRIANYNTVLPNSGTMGDPGHPIVGIGMADGGAVTFFGQENGIFEPGNIPLQGVIVTAAGDGSAINVVADGAHQFRDVREVSGPNNTCVLQFFASAIATNVVVYLGSGGGGFAMYAQPPFMDVQGTQPPACGSGSSGPLLFDPRTPFPGDPCFGPCTPQPAFSFVQTDGASAFFWATDGNAPGWGGIYSVSIQFRGNQLNKIVAPGDTLPDIGTVTSVGSEFSVDNGGVVFIATNASVNPPLTGIFLATDAGIRKILATGDTLDGFTVQPSTGGLFEVWPESYKNGKIAFNWGRGGGRAIYVASSCAADVSGVVTVSRGGFQFNRATGTFVQQVTLTNSGGSPISGPMELFIENLSGNATLSNASGTSGCLASGSPFVNVPLGAGNSLAPGASVSLTLSFSDPTRAAITYQPAVGAGSGTP